MRDSSLQLGLVTTTARLVVALAITFAAGKTGAQSPSATPATASSPADSSAPSLERWLGSASLWENSNVQFPVGRALGFHWLSPTHDAARASSRALHLEDLPVAEVIARFSPENAQTTATDPTPLSSVQVSIYNRGDSGDLEKNAFVALVERSKAALNSLTGVTPLERGTDNGSAVQSHGVVWVTPASRFLLEWSDTPENRIKNIEYRAEFIRLRVTPQREQPKSYVDQMRAQSTVAAGAAQPKTARAADLPARVVKEADGTERLPNIPMVDQGRKGYCVTAAAERVLRYYGVEVDQNELAQIANADAAAGTSPDAMVAALKKLASRFRVAVMTQYRLSYPDLMREIDAYNRVARSAPKTSGVSVIDKPSGSVDYQELCRQMKGNVLLEAKTKLNPAYMTTFERDVQTHIERGIPLLWSVELGLLPEEKLSPQAHGGHMRLIVGFNSKTHEILYSDTWGMGHELKKMPLANAWTITDGLYTLEPS